MKKISPWCIER